MKPDPTSYASLLWILEQRAQGMGYHTITRLLNEGIVLDEQPSMVPPTPGVLIYQRRPYFARQDPETGDLIHEPRPAPAPTWLVSTVEKMCKRTVAGVYAGILRWGERNNKFDEDADGNPKQTVHVDTGKPLIPEPLLRRVQAVELAAQAGEPMTMSAFNTFLLSMRCGNCGEAMSGYTSTKHTKGKAYTYRKYRCAGRFNRAGSCTMPMVSADALEQLVLDVVLRDIQAHSSNALLDKINAAVGRKRDELLRAMVTAETELRDLHERRQAALDALTFPFRSVSERTRIVLAAQADAAVVACDAIAEQLRKLRLGLRVLDEKARTITQTLADPHLDPVRWHAPEASVALKRALKLLVHKLILREQAPGACQVEVQRYAIREIVNLLNFFGQQNKVYYRFAITNSRFICK